MEKTNQLIRDFEDSLMIDGKSPRTVLSYVGDVKGFLYWLDQKKRASQES